jgi:hypothetical protein
MNLYTTLIEFRVIGIGNMRMRHGNKHDQISLMGTYASADSQLRPMIKIAGSVVGFLGGGQIGG